MMAVGFSRHEVQKVLRKYHRPRVKKTDGAASAWTCLHMFRTVILLRDREFYPLAEKVDDRKKTIFQFLTHLIIRYPEMFAELMLAVVNSDKRMQSLPQDSPERVIEEKFSALSDIKQIKKLAEALPGMSEKGLAKVRTRLSRANKIQRKWERFADSEVDIEVVRKSANGNILLYQKRRKN